MTFSNLNVWKYDIHHTMGGNQSFGLVETTLNIQYTFKMKLLFLSLSLSLSFLQSGMCYKVRGEVIASQSMHGNAFHLSRNIFQMYPKSWHVASTSHLPFSPTPLLLFFFNSSFTLQISLYTISHQCSMHHSFNFQFQLLPTLGLAGMHAKLESSQWFEKAQLEFRRAKLESSVTYSSQLV